MQFFFLPFDMTAPSEEASDGTYTAFESPTIIFGMDSMRWQQLDSWVRSLPLSSAQRRVSTYFLLTTRVLWSRLLADLAQLPYLRSYKLYFNNLSTIVQLSLWGQRSSPQLESMVGLLPPQRSSISLTAMMTFTR